MSSTRTNNGTQVPGKQRDEQANRPGPKRKFTDHNRNCVKAAAEALKAEDKEPTVNEVRQRCPFASVNPDTGEYFDDKLILDVF